MKFTLVTPSFAPDFERCRLLVETVNRFVAGIQCHYLIVDRRDLALFRSLTSHTTRILIAEDILDRPIQRDTNDPDQWIGPDGHPITNWVFQQLVKISSADAVDEDVLVFCDSDNAFIRPVDLAMRLLYENKLPLFRVEKTRPELEVWRDAAADLLGLPRHDVPAWNYVSNLVSWKREHVRAMQRRIETVHGIPWLTAMSRHAMVSEYMIYGIMIDHLIGIEASGQAHRCDPLIQASWEYPLRTEADLDAFFSSIVPGHIGVMIHSRDNVSPDRYRDRVLSVIK
jgi:hypothetical protein